MMSPSSPAEHRTELRRLGMFVAGFTGLTLASYLVPQAEAVRPWLPGEALPLVHLLAGNTAVREDRQGGLVIEEIADATPPSPAGAAAAGSEASDEGGPGPVGGVETPTGGDSPANRPPALPRRPPAVPTPLEIPDGALDAWFTELAKAEAGLPGVVVRTLHWGDSTIAADGITGTVRDRLQARFGDAGPGFLAVAVDPRWAVRPGIARWTKGDWESLSITFGGAPSPRYGLAGTVATATGEASVTLGGRKRPDAERNSDRQRIHRIDVYFQRQPGGGGLYVKPRGAPGVTLSTDSRSDRTWDDFHLLTVPEGAPTVWLKTDGSGPVTIYGVALETHGPGLTWETLGVAGSGQGSILSNQSARHLAGQVQRRQPHLVVYQTGGNELGYPSLTKGDGHGYAETYAKVLQRLRAGAPDASCLVISPLDQATRQRGKVVSKPMLARMIALQRQVAREEGCAFWDARAAMGGEGAFNRWLHHEPKLAWTDLMHLTDEGLALVGDSLADAILAAYDDWRRDHAYALPRPWVPPDP
ncbi:MAG: hypothetical protein D6798_18235, partial [Deltaproteobacteria bacterium]